MAAMIGADPEALDQLAGSFERQARFLDATAQRVRSQIHASPWQGGAANRFRADWDSTHMPRLRQTAGSLRTAATHLRRQAQEQRNASGFGASTPTGRWASGGVTPVAWWQDWKNLQTSEEGGWLFNTLNFAGALATLGANSSLVGRYQGGTPSNIFKYKATLNGIFSVNGLGDKANNIRGLGKISTVLGAAGALAEFGAFASSPSLGGASNVVEAGLKISTHPLVFLGGMALSSVHMTIDAANEADFSKEGFSQTKDYLASQGVGGAMNVMKEEVGEAMVDVFTKRIWRLL